MAADRGVVSPDCRRAVVSAPSDKAVERGDDYVRRVREGGVHRPIVIGDPQRILDLAHDPALGLDRSVCLRDVVEFAARFQFEEDVPYVAGLIAREFGGGHG